MTESQVNPVTGLQPPMQRATSMENVTPTIRPQDQAKATPVKTRDKDNSLRPGSLSKLASQVVSRGSLSKLAAQAVSRSGVVSTVVFAFMATVLVVSTWGLSTLANAPVNLGVVELSFFRSIYDIPINTFMRVESSVREVARDRNNVTATKGTQSLLDIQYDECGVRDMVCADKIKVNHLRVIELLSRGFGVVSGFELPQFVTRVEEIKFTYINTLTGHNHPAVQYHLPNEEWAIVCTPRRNRFRVAQEVAGSAGTIDSVAICSKRKYDKDWGCESEVSRDTTTYFFTINQGQIKYLGQAPRSEVYYNPGNIARLSGGSFGTVFLSYVVSIDEFNGGILVASAPWDAGPAFLCKGTFDPATNMGMRWQGLGKVEMVWESASLMVTNSLVLWALATSLVIVQALYLPRSSVCMVPVILAKSLVGPIVLGYACFDNYHVQILTTYIQSIKVTSFNAEPYRLCGPAMLASVVGIMSGTVMQMFFNPYLVSPSYVLTIVSAINWVIVFVLEAYVFPMQSTMLPRDCELPSSTNCINFSATKRNYYLSPIISASTVILGVIAVQIIRHQTQKQIDSKRIENSVLSLFGVKSVHRLATSGVGGVIKTSENGRLLLDAGVLLEKNLIRVSKTVIVRTAVVKYVILYCILPKVFARQLSQSVGLVIVVHVDGDRVMDKITFMELDEMDLSLRQHLPSYYS